MINIRHGTPADRTALRALARRAWQAGYAELLPKEYLDSLGTDREPARPPQPPQRTPTKIARLIAELDGIIVGAALVTNARDLELPETHGELAVLNVDPDHWHRGIGRTLLNEAEAWLRSIHLINAVLWTFADNQRARTFYEASGWTPDGATRTESLTPFRLAELRYGKTLTA